MQPPLCVQLVCPHCGQANSVPGFSYAPQEEVLCFHCGNLFFAGQGHIKRVVPQPAAEQAPQLAAEPFASLTA